MLSRLVIAFLPRNKHLLISWLQSPFAVILEPKKMKSLTVSIVSHLFAMKTVRRPNQSILKEISPGISLERMMLKLKLPYFGHLMRRVDSLGKTLMLGGFGAGGERDDIDGWMASLTRGRESK